MKESQLDYLKENKEQVLDFWLSEFDTDPQFSLEEGNSVSAQLLSYILDEILKTVETGKALHIERGACGCGCEGNRGQFVRGEFYRSGKAAFTRILNPEWDFNLPFNSEERIEALSLLTKKVEQAAKTL